MPIHPSTTSTATKRSTLPSSAYFKLLDALPQPISVRGETLDLLYLNKAAEERGVLLDILPTFHTDNYLQQTLKIKAALLFQEINEKAAHDFEVEIDNRYIKVYQSLEQLPTGERVIVETLKDITDAKTNALAVSLMSTSDDDEKEESKYLDNLTQRLGKAFNVDMVIIAITDPGGKKNTTLSCWDFDKHIDNFSYDLAGSPCGELYEIKKTIIVPEHLQSLYPEDEFFITHNFISYFGIPLFNSKKEITGIVSLMNKNKFTDLALLKNVLNKLIPKLSLEVGSRMQMQNLEVNKGWTSQVINSYKNGMCVYDKDYKLRLFNKTYAARCKEQFDIHVEPGSAVLDLVAQQLSAGIKTSLTTDELSKRKDWLKLAFSGQHHTQYITLKKENKTVNFALSYNPIYSHNNTSVTEVLLLSHDMTELINSKKDLERIKKHYYSVFDNSYVGIEIYDLAQKKAIDCNDAFLKLFGLKNKEEVNQFQLGQLSPEYQPNGALSATLVSNILTQLQENKKLQYNWMHSRLDGSTFFSETSFIPLNDEQPGLFFIAIKDLSEQMTSEQLLKQKNLELEQYIESNMQLENLAYSACHDLKEPLRTIGTFTQIIQKKYEHLIDDKSKEYMGFIVNGVSRMNNFVDSLFTYSRVKENQQDFEEFSLSKLIEFIQIDLNQSIEENKAVIQLENIPQNITANRTKIKQLFQNLITNAIKFQPEGQTPNINITGSETDTHWHFSISDNGIGISEEYFDQIFTLFRKLHSRDKFEGSGIGLALCKEIVEQHKGTITVTSEQGLGTTFEFGIMKELGNDLGPGK